MVRNVLSAACLAGAAAALVFSNLKAQDPGGVLHIPDPFAHPTEAPPAAATGTATPRPKHTPRGAAPAATTPAPASTPPIGALNAGPSPTIVDANQRVQATKRGVCENHLSMEDFMALGKGVSWYYNWAANTSDIAPASSHMEFIPMAWGRGGDPGAIAGALGRNPRVVLALNEPNLKGQAFLTPQAAADFYLKVKQAADGSHVPVVGPNMALGSPADGSITAVDPVTKQKTTYTSMSAYLAAYFYYVKQAQAPAGIGVHSYNGIGDLRAAVNTAYGITHKPVWVTEFAWWDAPNPQEELNYLRQAVEFMEGSSQVAGYAWFKERVDKNPKISLLDKEAGKLTPLGQEYVKLPSHSMHVFYRVPGQLDAGKYVSNANMTLQDTTDAEGDFDMVSSGPAWVAYNIQVDVPGTYVLKLRVSGAPGKIDVMQEGQVIGSAETSELQWHTVETQVALIAGAQTIRVQCNGQALHYIDFSVKPGVAAR